MSRNIVDPLNQIIINKLKDVNTNLEQKHSSFNATAGNGSTISGEAYVKSIHCVGYIIGDNINNNDGRFSAGYTYGGVNHRLIRSKLEGFNATDTQMAQSATDSQTVTFEGKGLWIPSGDTLTLNATATDNFANGAVYVNVSALYTTAV